MDGKRSMPGTIPWNRRPESGRTGGAACASIRAPAMTLYLSGSPGGQFLVWTLDRPRLAVGRSSRNELQLGDFTVSKEHAEIIVDGSRVLIRDLGSRNGTRVNGVDAREAMPLKPGDQVEIGHVALVVTAERPEQPLALDERAVAGSSHRIQIDQVLERRAHSSAGASALVRLLSQAGQLLVLPRPRKETCDQILEIVAQAVPASRYVVLLRELASRLLGLEQARVLDLHRRHVREQGQHFELLLRERAGEVLAVHVDQPQHLLVVEQRHRHRRVDRLRDDALLRAEALVRGGVGGEHR